MLGSSTIMETGEKTLTVTGIDHGESNHIHAISSPLILSSATPVSGGVITLWPRPLRARLLRCFLTGHYLCNQIWHIRGWRNLCWILNQLFAASSKEVFPSNASLGAALPNEKHFLWLWNREIEAWNSSAITFKGDWTGSKDSLRRLHQPPHFTVGSSQTTSGESGPLRDQGQMVSSILVPVPHGSIKPWVLPFHRVPQDIQTDSAHT